MNGFGALLKKELWEQLKTYRVIVVGSVFLFFGITTPLLLKYTPELLKLAGEQMQISLPPPTAVQSLVEYAGTVGQIGVLVAVLVAMGCVANEIQRGTAVITLSKPVTRLAFVLSKLTAVSTTFILSLAVGSAFCLVYSVVLIGQADVISFVGLNLLVALFLVFCLAVTVMFSSMFKSSLAAGGVSAGVLVGQAVISVLPLVGDYMPGKLLGWGNALFTGSKSYWPALVVTVALIGLSVYLAQRLLKNKEM